MRMRFKRQVVEHELGIGQAVLHVKDGESVKPARELKLGDVIEYPFKGRIWRVIDLGGEYVTLEN